MRVEKDGVITISPFHLLLSEYIFVVSCRRRSCRRQDAQFFLTMRTALLLLPLLPVSSAFCLEVKRRLKDALCWPRFINASKQLPTIIFSHLLLQKMRHSSDGAVSVSNKCFTFHIISNIRFCFCEAF